VKLPIRLVPYLLLGTLTLGAALGAGLGLSQGPITHTGVGPNAPVVISCASSSDPKKTVVTCTSPGSNFSYALTFFKKPTPPTELDACLASGLAPYWSIGTVRYANGTIQFKEPSGSTLKQALKNTQRFFSVTQPIIKKCEKSPR
jgi:hypothetical protein